VRQNVKWHPVNTAAKEESTSGLLAVLLETRVRGSAPKNTTDISPEPSVSSTLRWDSWQAYDRTAVERLVGLDYFGARYFSAAQGRFTSVDPIGAAKQKLIDPQQWNMYSYGRNNPLRFIDPSGKRVELIGTDDERRKQLEALKAGVGSQAGQYLTVRKDSGFLGLGKTHYYVTTTNSKAFESTNAVAEKVGGIINDQNRTVQIHTVSSGTRLGAVTIGSAPGATPLTSFSGPAAGHIYVSSGALGNMPAALMENHTASPVNLGVALIHELGHVDASWYHGGFAAPPTAQTMTINNGDAVRIENQARMLFGLPLRIGHDVPFDVPLLGPPY
jgi:RHS repeat-associated protein